MNLNYSENDNENEPDNEYWSVYEGKNDDITLEELSGEYSYNELFRISKPLEKNLYESLYLKWNVFNVSSYDDINQIFYDIANSKQARKKYWTANFMLILEFIILMLLLAFSIFSIVGTAISNKYFLWFESWIWQHMSGFSAPLLIVYYVLIQFSFKTFSPTFEKVGEIDMSYGSNKTGFFKIIQYGIGGPFWVLRQKNLPKSKYRIYKAHNRKFYLMEPTIFGRNYVIRNWYLVSKYIVCKKMKIDNLPKYFKNELFIFLTNKNYKNEKIKLHCFFNFKFSLNFFYCFNFIFFFLALLIVPISYVVVVFTTII